MTTELDRAVSKQTKSKDYADIPEVARDLSNLLNDEVTSDIKILVEDFTIYAHTTILKMRRYFILLY
jgi:hypothetical protein